MLIQINKNPDKWHNFKFGIAALFDGLIRGLSFGLLFSSFQLNCSREHARKHIQKLKDKKYVNRT